MIVSNSRTVRPHRVAVIPAIYSSLVVVWGLAEKRTIGFRSLVVSEVGQKTVCQFIISPAPLNRLMHGELASLDGPNSIQTSFVWCRETVRQQQIK